jgi:SNF2 family DNA or RNA helicase
MKNRVKFSVLITSYETLLADITDMRTVRLCVHAGVRGLGFVTRQCVQIPWTMVVVDEGQRLKNRKASMLQALKEMRIERRLLLSGTPLQNNTEELWTLMNFIEPVRACVSVCQCVSVPVWFCVSMSLCLCAPVSMCLCVYVSMCLCV